MDGGGCCQAHMMLPVTNDSIDVTSEMFGRGVVLYRINAGMSQRELAEQLRDRGLTFDTAAVSRVESGKRSVRLAEAVTIASVLGVPLEMLVSGGRESPAAAYDKAITRADQAVTDLRRTFVDAAVKQLQVVSLLNRNPELLTRLHAPEVSDGDGYLEHVATIRRRIEEQLLQRDALDNGRYVFVETDKQRDDLIAIARATIETSIVTRDEVQRRHGETQNPTE